MNRKVLKRFHLHDDEILPFCRPKIFSLLRLPTCTIRVALLQLLDFGDGLFEIPFRNLPFRFLVAKSSIHLKVQEAYVLSSDQFIVNPFARPDIYPGEQQTDDHNKGNAYLPEQSTTRTLRAKAQFSYWTDINAVGGAETSAASPIDGPDDRDNSQYQ
ncbi:hypothetical protein D3C76_1252670 [compost metagenome]